MKQTKKKKLTAVALPLDAINKASAREKSMRGWHASTPHNSLDRRLSIARARFGLTGVYCGHASLVAKS